MHYLWALRGSNKKILTLFYRKPFSMIRSCRNQATSRLEVAISILRFYWTTLHRYTTSPKSPTSDNVPSVRRAWVGTCRIRLNVAKTFPAASNSQNALNRYSLLSPIEDVSSQRNSLKKFTKQSNSFYWPLSPSFHSLTFPLFGLLFPNKICCARRCSGFLVWQKHNTYLTIT